MPKTLPTNSSTKTQTEADANSNAYGNDTRSEVPTKQGDSETPTTDNYTPNKNTLRDAVTEILRLPTEIQTQVNADSLNNAFVDFLGADASIKGQAYTQAAQSAVQAVDQISSMPEVSGEVKARLTELRQEIVNNVDGMVELGGTNTSRVVNIPKPTKVAEFFPYMCEIGKRTDLNVKEKVQILQEAYYDLGDGNRKDIHCPIDAKFLKENGFTKNGYSDYDWPDRWGFRDDYESITRENNKLPDIMDRNGSLGGNTFTELPIDRAPYTYDEMSLPYIRNPEANHRAVYDRPDGYYFNVINAIRNNDLDGLNVLLDMNGIESVKRTEMYDLVEQYNDFINDAKSRGVKKDATYGIFGYADEWVNKETGEVYLNGGAPQYTVPLTVKQLIRLGIFTNWR